MPNELDMDAYHQEGIDPGEHKVFNITPTIHSFDERFQGEPQGISNEDIINRTMGFLPHNEQMPLGWWRTDTPKHEGVDLDAYSDYQKLIARYPKPTKKDMSLFQDTELDFGPNDAARYQQPYDPDAEFAKDLMYKPISDKQVPFAPYTSKSIEDIATKHKVEVGQIKDILKDLNEHPENIIGTGELGGTALTPELWNAAKALRKQGFSIRNIAEYLGLGHTNLERAFTRGGEEGTAKIAQPWSPPVAGHAGDPEYEKALSDWMKNQE